MNTKPYSRFLAMLLALVMVLSMFPAPARAAETATWTKVEAAAITADDTIMVTMTTAEGVTYALPTVHGSKGPVAHIVTVAENTITTDGTVDFGWTITAVEGGYTLTTTDGQYLYTTAANSGVRVGATQAVWAIDGDHLTANDTGGTQRWLGVYTDNPDWRAYTSINTNIQGQVLGFYKLTDTEGGGEETPDPSESEPDTPEVTIVTIKEALAGETGTSFTVKGVVTLVDGKNVYVQDETGGICLYFATAPTDIVLGETLIGTGSRKDYNGLPELDAATYEKSSGLTLTAKEVAKLADLTDADLCCYIKLSGLEITEVNGTTLTVKDADGTTMKTYKSVLGDTVYAVGDVIDFTGALGIYNSMQLRNTLATEIVKISSATPDDPYADIEKKYSVYEKVNTLTAGDTVIAFNAGNGMILSSAASGYKLSGVAGTDSEGLIAVYDETIEWVVGTNGDNWTFTQDDKALGMVVSGSYINLSTDAAAGYTDWTLEASETAGVFYMKNTNMPAGTYGPYYLEYFSGFTAYASSTPADAAFGISFYKLVREGIPEEEPVDPPVEEPEYVPIAEALAGESGTEFTVKGVVTLVDGKNIYVQDETGGICLYMSAAPSDIALGDTVIGTGSRKDYSGLPELDAATYVKSEGLTLSAKVVSDVSTLTTADICTYIKLVGMEITEVYDKNGTYTSPNITVQDASGNKIQLYKAVTTKTDGTWDWKVGDMVTISGGLGVYNTTLQMRNTLATEIVAYDPVEQGKVTSAEEFTTGSYVMVVETGYAPGVLDGTWVTAVQPVIEDDKVTDAMGGIWTLTVNGSTVEICDSNGIVIAPGAADKNAIQGGAYQWDWTFDAETGTFVFSGNSGASILASNTGTGANKFRAYKNGTVSGNPSGYPHAFTLYKVAPAGGETGAGKPEAGAQVVIYNVSAEGVLAAEGDNQVINNALTAVTDGVATPANGGAVFAVEVNGSYYRFYNETYGYLCSNGTGNNAFYSKEASEDADWILTSGKKGGFNLESRTAKFNGQYSQYLEYYSDSYKTYSMYNVTDYDIYEFFFYPVAEDVNVTEGIVNVPNVIFADNGHAYLTMDYEYRFSVDSVFGIQELTVASGNLNKTYEYTLADGVYTVIVPAADLEIAFASEIPCLGLNINGTDTKGVSFQDGSVIDIFDEPLITDVTPASNAETGDDKRPVISAVISNAGEDATVTMTLNEEAVEVVFADGVAAYEPTGDMADGRYSVTVTVTRADGKTAEKTWAFTVGKAQYSLYFGQLHSHTTYSDGSGSLESALEYIGSLPESANVDFVAFTDHSNYFDDKNAVNPEAALYDTTQATADSMSLWNSYVSAALSFNASQSEVIAVPGFEMTWSGGPGHMNTFNTPGIVSRNNSTLNNKTSDAGMKAYYALLSNSALASSVNQFNHPGSTFGTFSDFAYWDAVIDSRIQLVEVGNGEGQVGAGGYFPSYEYYTMALDKGWHVAPTNNQDNHKGKWGNANDARDVIVTDNFTLEGIYEAIRQRRVYATEDKNLEINYTVNGQLLGHSFKEIPEKLNLNVQVFDPDAADSISKVEVIVNSGKVAHTWSSAAELATGNLSVTLDPTYSYYYIRVTQGDGDLAVTAPVWVGDTLMLGISSVVCGTSTPVTGEELTLTTTLFNSEKSDATVKSLTYTIGDEVIGTDATGHTVAASSTEAVEFKYTPDKAKLTTITVTAVVEQDGQEYTFTMTVELDVQDASKLVYIGIDASHYNEYVAGNYKDSMGNFGALAAQYSVRTVELKTSEELIAACANDKYKALILTAPSRRLAAAQSDPRTYSAAELEAITAFNAKGGMVILAGWSDNYENYDVIKNNPETMHMAATQNAVLEALGSTLRIADDATYDDVRSAADGVDKWRLYFSTYGDNFLTEGVILDAEHPYDRYYTEVFSHYGGASVYATSGTLPATVSPVVFGHATTYSVDVDGDGLGGNVPKYAYAEGDDRLMAMAMEQLEGKGLIVVSGAAFMSNFEVQATLDNGAEKNYSNYRICENLLKKINPVEITPIAEVQAEKEEGIKFTIEGIVTSNASGYDKDTAFFDCIYLQDETAGINAFPVAGNFKIGDKVRITGTTSSYQGERQIAVTSIQLLSEGNEVTAREVTAAQINDRSVLGSLVTLSGTVTSFQLENGLVQTIMVKDAGGNEARVFIDGYICTSKDVENLEVGCNITVTGLASYDDTFNAPEGPFARIRIRSRADVVCTEKQVQTKPTKIVNVVSGVHVYWDAVEGVSKYGLWRSETGKDGTYKWLGNPTAAHFTDTKVESGKTYWYKVTIMDTATNTHSEKSAAIGITYVGTPNITLRVNRAVGIGLRWNKVEGATGYAVYRKSYSGTDAWVRVATIESGNTLSWDDTSVKGNNGVIYKYTIRALAGSNNKTLSGCYGNGLTMVRLTSRTLYSAAASGKNAVKVSWATTSQAAGYEVRFMADGKVYKTYTIGSFKTGVKTFTGLESGKTYKIQVRSYKMVDGIGTFYSAWSTAKTVKLG